MSETITRGITGAVIVLVIVAASYLSVYSALVFWSLITVLAIIELRKNKMGGSLTALYLVVVCCSMILLGFVSYDSGIFSFKTLSREAYDGMNLVVFMCVIWANDTFAYLGGRLIGKKVVKVGLAPNISPNKSWEGALIGSLSAAFIGYLFLGSIGVIIALITSVTATLSDLIESKGKRKVGIKDSGNLLPGHGGILDRFDALLLSAPITFIAVYLLSQ